MRLLELRGMRASVLIDLVHRNGGVIRTGTSLWGEISEFCQHKEVL